MHSPNTVDTEALWNKTWPKIVARAWNDPSFMTRWSQDPQGVAQEYALPITGNSAIALKLSTPVPARPSDLALESMEELSRYAEEANAAQSSCV